MQISCQNANNAYTIQGIFNITLCFNLYCIIN